MKNFKYMARPAGILLALAVLFWTVTAQAATLVSDKDDYAPGETVYLSGTGFWPGESVAITLAVHTVDGTVLDYAVGGIVADANGDILATWLVPQEALDTSIEATAIGDQSALVATAYFTDSHGTHNVNFATAGLPEAIEITIAGSRINPGHNSANFSQSFNTPGPSNNTGCQAGGSTVTYSGFPPVVPASGGNYVLQNTNPVSPFLTGSKDDVTTVTATYAFVPDEVVECPTNTAPTLTACDLEPTDICAVWNGETLTVTVPVEADDFNPVTEDADGDDVTVSLSVTEVTLTGLGEVEVEVTLTATDDPSWRYKDECTLEPASTIVTVKVKANLTFAFVGFDKPLDNNTARKVKNGSTVPVKFRLYDCEGTEICDMPDPPSIWVGLQTCYAPEGGVEVDDSGASNDNTLNFRYSGECGEGTWIYNLSTKNGYVTGNTYKIVAVLADGTTHDVLISINK